MPILRRYGVADAVEFPLIKRAAVDFATTSNYTPVGSDTRIHIDAASASYTTNVLQVTGSHGWSIAFTAAELTGKLISLVVQDADTKAVEDQFISIETYGSPLAQHPFDFSVPTVTLSQPALDALAVQVVNTVWATASRTLSSFGTLQADIVNNVWATPSRTLAQAAYDQVVNQMWATGSRTLSSFGTLVGDVVNDVWSTPSRTLSSFGTLQGDIVNNVWATGSRTITGTGTDAIAAASIAAAAGSKIADIVLRRTAANARASSDGDAANFRTLLGATSKLVNKVAVNGANLEIMQENDTTVYGTQVATTDSAAAPITALDTT